MSLKLANVEAILAIDLCNGLSKNGQIPWKSKTDMTFFKNKTLNHVVIMGSKTLLTLPNMEPLKNRTNIVITNEKEKYSELYGNRSNLIFIDFEETLRLIKTDKNRKFFIIGGNQIYNLLLPYCSVIWLTKIKKDYDCDLIISYNTSTYVKDVVYEDNELEIMQFR